MTDTSFRRRLFVGAEPGPGFLVRDVIRFFAVDLILTASVRLLLLLGLFPGMDSYVLSLLGGKCLLFAYLLWLIRERREAWPETGGASAGKWWAWPLTLLMYIAYLPVALGVDWCNTQVLTRLYAWLGRVFVPRVQDVVVLLFDDLVNYPVKIVLVAFILFLGPFMEELAFRGMGLDAFRRSGGLAAAIVWSSLLFGFFHFSLQLVIPLTALGVLFAAVRLATGSLWPAFFAHFLHNALALALTARSLGLVDFPWFIPL